MTVQTVVTNRVMTGSLKLPPLEFLMRMSPLAAIQAFACATATGELSAFWALVQSGEFGGWSDLASVLGNGLLAFFLNISSFEANRVSGALTMTVCGNLKQCLTVGLGIFLFDVHTDLIHGLGMAVTMFGAMVYSKSELDSKLSKQRQQQQQEHQVQGQQQQQQQQQHHQQEEENETLPAYEPVMRESRRADYGIARWITALSNKRFPLRI